MDDLPNMEHGARKSGDVEPFSTAHCVGAADFYSCDEAIRRLNDYLDHELTEPERVVVIKHLEICKSCFSRFTFEQTLIVSLRRKVTCLHAPEGLLQRLHGLLRRTG